MSAPAGYVQLPSGFWVAPDGSGPYFVDVATGAVQAIGSGVSYTWTTRPAAAGRAGQVIRVSDVGATGAGSHWVSDGTNWRAVNGSVVICNVQGSLTTPLASATGATSATFTALTAATKIPGGMLIPGSSSVEIEALFHRIGATATAIASISFGTLGTSSDSNVYAFTSPATSLSDLFIMPSLRVSEAGRIQSSNWTTRGGSGGTGTILDRTTNINTAADMYATLHYSSANAADTFQIIAYRVTVNS